MWSNLFSYFLWTKALFCWQKVTSQSPIDNSLSLHSIVAPLKYFWPKSLFLLIYIPPFYTQLLDYNLTGLV